MTMFNQNSLKNKKETQKNTLYDCLSEQLTEFELLKSMYPDQGEIVVSDKNIIYEINDFISHHSEYIPNNLDFKLNLIVNKIKLEIFFTLPSYYPKEVPDICVRCNQLNRQNESRLNFELSDYILKQHAGEACLYTAISWLQENIHNFNITMQEPSTANPDNELTHQDNDKFARLWIYSHHIYNKKKREEIVKKAKQLKLTGFSLPGKPGIICIEGPHCDCNEWWKDIKSMNWQKIVVKKIEVFETNENATYKKFMNFEELNLNKSDLAKYMNKRGFGKVFNELFGLSIED